MANYGIKVARPGYDVATATLLQQEFNSSKNCFKIGLEGSSSSTADGARTVEVEHGMSITPGYLCWFQIDASGKWYPCFSTDYISGKYGNLVAYTTSSKLYLTFSSMGSATMKAYYILFYDPGD